MFSSDSRTVLTSTLVITKADSGKTLSNYRISTTRGECVSIVGATNVTIHAFDIGPCGENNSRHPSNGIHIRNSSAINVYDSYIHVQNQASGGCCDSHDGILVTDGSSNINIQGNVIGFNETNIELMGRRGAIKNVSVVGNYLLNPQGPFPRGQNVQSWSGRMRNSNIIVRDNYLHSCTTRDGGLGIMCSPTDTSYPYPENQEDSISFGYTENFSATGNRVEGGHSPAGCGIVIDKGATNGNIAENFLFNIGQCGIGVADGASHSIANNRVLSLSAPSNVGIYVWSEYGGGCGPVRVVGNLSSALAASSTHCNPDQQSCDFNGYWSSGCEVDAVENVFDNGQHLTGGGAAYRLLVPILLSNPAPLIPPKPMYCIAASPYSTQTSAIACN